MNVADIGETGLIELLIDMAHNARVATSSNHLQIGPGDDAAAWQPEAGMILSTTDTAVEGVHFTRSTIPWIDLGWKVMAANLSDIAAMGGTPLYALVSVGLPPETAVKDVQNLYQGIIDGCREYGVALAGGDTVASPTIFITVAIHGTHNGSPLLRSQAMAGDLLAVTGTLGCSEGGLQLLTNNRDKPAKAAYEHLIGAHRRPRPRLSEGRTLVEQGILAAMDISDGLIEDLSKMMRASGKAARVNSAQVPIHESLYHTFPDCALNMALSGGEDYQLLYAGPPALMQPTISKIPGATVIGSVNEGPAGHVSIVDQKGENQQLVYKGWAHFHHTKQH